MSIYYSDIVLDGINNGIGAFIRSTNKWLVNNKSNMFPNMKTLNSQLFRMGVDYHDVNIYFLLNDKVTGKATILIGEAVKTGENTWQIARKDEEINGVNFLHIYKLTETCHEVLVKIAYLSNKDSNTHDPNKDPKYEYAKHRKLRSMSNNIINTMAGYQQFGLSVIKTRYGSDVYIDNSSAVIHVWTLAKLMDYNTDIKKMRSEDKNSTDRCLPFTPGNDKYGSLYVFATCDENDFAEDAENYNSTMGKILSFMHFYITMLQERYPDSEFKLTDTEFGGKVYLLKEVINRGRNTESGKE